MSNIDYSLAERREAKYTEDLQDVETPETKYLLRGENGKRLRVSIAELKEWLFND